MAKAGKSLTQEQIEQIVASSRPERLSDPAKRPMPGDHAAHVVRLVGWGHAALAADHLLFPEITGALPAVVAGVIRQLNIRFAQARLRAGDSGAEAARKIRDRQFGYEALLEMALNFSGLESRWLDAEERREAIRSIQAALAEWEAVEATEGQGSVAGAVVRQLLHRMRLVQQGGSMVARTATRIGEALDFGKPALVEFLRKAQAEIEGNIYTRLVREGRCRFGNDYALGLRWLRHLGFEQVSTNPVLAARAYQDDPRLSEIFRSEVRSHRKFRQWTTDPERHGDEIALYATLLALWDNLHVYRPVFFNLAETSGGGVVSFQLNPNIAHLTQESIQDVFAAFAEATEDLRVYDDYLLAGYRATRERARPNMVIKVAATSPAAREIARTINTFGFGSNITVIYSVGQEVTMILEEMAGMAGALRKGIRPTQLYMTNMGGRLESHLRELKLEELFAQLKQAVGELKGLARVNQLAAANGTRAKVDQAKGYEAKVVAATRFPAQRTIDANVIAALQDVASEEELKAWEEAIGRSGTLVARRVWSIFFPEGNREKWQAYLARKYPLSREQTRLILDRIYYLPASKRKPQDTYWTLTGKNMVHTEFPDHQENVRRMAEAEGFVASNHFDSITAQFPAEVVERLNTLPDFRRSYEVNADISQVLGEVGIAGDLGTGGLTPEQWPEYGPVQKTSAEFKAAYDKFRDDVLALFKQVAKPARGAKRVAMAARAVKRAAKKPAPKATGRQRTSRR